MKTRRLRRFVWCLSLGWSLLVIAWVIVRVTL